MLIRIVKMTIKTEQTGLFEQQFSEYKERIRSRKGCCGLQLLNDKNDRRIFFTWSKWEAESDLENYRKSELFEEVWTKTKLLFDDKPEAWSVNEIVAL